MRFGMSDVTSYAQFLRELAIDVYSLHFGHREDCDGAVDLILYWLRCTIHDAHLLTNSRSVSSALKYIVFYLYKYNYICIRFF